MFRKNIPVLIILVCVTLATISLGVCYGGVESVCAPGKNENTAIFIILFSISTALSNIPLAFLSPSVFSSWFHFSKYYLPIAALLIILSPVSDGSLLGFDKEFISWFLAGTFFVVSMVLIVYKQPRTRMR